MLCLGFKVGQWVRVGDMRVIVSEAHDGKVRLAFDGPREVPVVRGDAKVRAPQCDMVRTIFTREPLPVG